MASTFLAIFLVALTFYNVDAWRHRWCSDTPPSPGSSYYKWFIGPQHRRCYRLVSRQMSWQDANDHCKSLDSDAFLAVISTKMERDWISKSIKYAPGYDSTQSYWVGAEKKGYRWRWNQYPSLSVDRFMWYFNEPNGSGTKGAIDQEKGIDWRLYDREEWKRYPFICEIPKDFLGGGDRFLAPGVAANAASDAAPLTD